MGRGSIGLLLLLLAVGLVLPTSAFATTSSISGTVTASGNGQPIERAQVCAYWMGETPPPEGLETACHFTAADGTYAISNLALGEYRLEFETPSQGFIRQYYDHVNRWSEATSLTLESGGLTGIDAALRYGGAIAGTVTAAASGSPVENVEVCASEAASEPFVECTLTDSTGSYLVKSLESGEYKTSYWPEPSDGLLPQYYAGKPTFAEADAISVLAGEVIPSIDVGLAAEPRPPEPPSLSFPESGPVPWPIIESTPPAHRLRCRRGFVKRRIKGHLRCVKRHRRHRHHRRSPTP